MGVNVSQVKHLKKATDQKITQNEDTLVSGTIELIGFC